VEGPRPGARPGPGATVDEHGGPGPGRVGPGEIEQGQLRGQRIGHQPGAAGLAIDDASVLKDLRQRGDAVECGVLDGQGLDLRTAVGVRQVMVEARRGGPEVGVTAEFGKNRTLSQLRPALPVPGQQAHHSRGMYPKQPRRIRPGLLARGNQGDDLPLLLRGQFRAAPPDAAVLPGRIKAVAGAFTQHRALELSLMRCTA